MHLALVVWRDLPPLARKQKFYRQRKYFVLK